MIVKRIWKQKWKSSTGLLRDSWLREGWYLFGFIPLYVRDLQERDRK